MELLNLTLAAALPLLQVPEAPFAENQAELVAPSVVMADGCIRAGTKALTWQNRDENLDILAGGQAVAKFMIRVKPSHPGWQPFVNFTNTVADGVVTRRCPFGLAPGKKGLFTQTIAVEGTNAVVVSRFEEPEGLAIKETIITAAMPKDIIAGRRVRLTDKSGKVTDVAFPSLSDWYAGGVSSQNLWETQGQVSDPVAVTFDPDHPARSYTLRFEPGAMKGIRLVRATNCGYLYFLLGSKPAGKDLRMTISFGLSEKASADECVIDGINFTRDNAFEVPRWGRRNILNNPSFESNTRYWHGGCFQPTMMDDKLVSDAHTGRAALRGWAMAFCVPTKPNRKYTFSCWAKAVRGEGGTIALSTFNYTWCGGNVKVKLPLKKGVSDWQRVTHTFDWPYRGIALALGASAKEGDVLLDDVQLEEGAVATDFEMPPFGVVLKTDAPDGLWADVGVPFNARVVIRGAAGAKGVAKLTVTDFFGRETWKGTVPFAVGADGETEVPACPESAVAARGVFRIRVELDTGDGRPFVDHVRLTRFRYATGEEPNRELHQIEGMGWMTRKMLDYSDVNWRRYSKQGVKVHVRTTGDWWGPFDEKLRKEVADWAIGHGGHVRQVVFPQNVYRGKMRHPIWGYLNEEGIAWDNMPDVTKGYGEKELAAVERAVARLVREHSWCTQWVGTSELGLKWPMTKAHDYQSYARLIMAAHRGVKRGNPQATFYAHGTCNAGPQGRAELHEFMEATKALDPTWAWDGLQVHPYRAHPEFPSLESDLKQLYDDMARHNMPEGIVSADEGAYFFPMLVKEWNDISPWAATLPKDMFRQMHAPGYDLGWGERVATAMLLRYNLQCYRFLPRIRNVTSWNHFTLDVYTPWALYVGTAAETELLGYAKYHSDIRFGDGARAYFFDDGKGGAVAVVWKFNVALDKGVEKAAEMRVDAAALKGCEIFDMMGNLCAVDVRDGEGRAPSRLSDGRARTPAAPLGADVENTLKLPLSNFPVYLRVPIAKMDSLVAAIRGCTTSDDGKVRKLYDPPVTDIPQCGEKPDWTAIAPIALPYAQQSQLRRVNGEKGGGPDDLSATCKMAWNERGLFLRVEAKDDVFCLDRSTYRYGACEWYRCEGVQVFFDSYADGRENFKMEMTGFAEDDSLYELLPTNETAAVVFRRVAPDIQQTGGVGDILKANVIDPDVRCDFKWDAAKKTRVYEAFFPARQLQPMVLKAGSKIGCSFVVYDRDEKGRDTKQWVTDVPLEVGAPYEHPHLYSNFRLAASGKGCSDD